MRHPAEKANEMRVMHVQVEHRAARGSRVMEVGDPLGIGNDPLEIPAQELPVLSRCNRLVGKPVFGEERQDVGHHQVTARVPGRPEEAVRIGRLQRDGLFAQDVLAGLQRRRGRPGMPGRRQADIDQVELGIGEHFFQRRVAEHALQIHHAPFGSEIPPNRPPVPGQPAGILLVNGRDPGLGQPLVGQ